MRDSKRKKILLFFVAVIVCFMSRDFLFHSVSHARSSDPLDGLKVTVDKAMAVITDKNLAGEAFRQERITRITELVRNRFEFHEMSKRTLGQHWKNISPGEQERFVDLFAKLLEKTYARKIDSYSSEKIIFKGEEIRGNKAVVESIIVRNEVEIPLVYRLIKKDQDWLIYDVVIEGVSLVTNYRSQFENIIAREKFHGLMAKIEDRLTKEE